MSIPSGRLYNDTSDQLHPLFEVSLIGRSRDCALVVSDLRVSRRHAMIRRQNDGFWFLDLGSINGSYINDRRVTAAHLLANGDRIRIADQEFRFEGEPGSMRESDTTLMSELTLSDVRSRDAVILVSDVKGFTTLSEQLDTDHLAPIIGSWYRRTELILAPRGATIDKFIGDSVLAYWLDISPTSRLAALAAAHEMQRACDAVQDAHQTVLKPTGLTFGTGAAIHLGPVAYGSFSPKEFTLLGDAVNLAFRLESLTRSLAERVLVSGEVIEGWSAGASFCRSLGSHSIKGRTKPVSVYVLDRDPMFSTS